MPAKTTGKDNLKELLQALRSATKGLLFPSESDKPVHPFIWESKEPVRTVDEAALKAVGKVPEGSTIKEVTLEKFFEPVIAAESWWGDEEKAQAKQYEDLLSILKGKLSDLTVFRIENSGDDSSVVDAYVVGRTADGTLAGVSTQLVET